MLNQKYIFRGDRSGVFYGEMIARNGKEVTIGNCRCIWYWDGAATLLQLALEGVRAPHNCKFTVTVESLDITDCIEIIPCTEKAVKSIEGVPEWRA